MKFKSEVQLEALNNAAVDTDKFLVSDSSTIKYRTGAEVLSDIGAAPASGSGNYIQNQIASAQSANMWISGNAYVNGNVGIGTSTSAAKLVLNSGTLNQNALINGDKIGFTRTSDAAEVVYFKKDTSLGTEGTANINGYDGIQFRTQGPETVKAIITSSGNVGIGTTSPFNKLTVGGVPASGYGLITISSDWASGTAISTGIKIGAANDTGSAGVDIRSHSNYSATSGTEMSFWTNSTSNALSERMRITSSGNVGIGTTNPTTALYVSKAGTGSFNVLTLQNSQARGANVGVRLNFQANSDFSGSDSGGAISVINTSGSLQNSCDLLFETGTLGISSEKMRITASGNVGIGTSNIPYGNLALKSNSATTYGGFNVFASSNDNFVALNHTGTVGVIETESVGYSPSDLTIRTAGSERMRITTNGNVGIGTTSPSGILDVQKNQNTTTNFYFQNTDTTNTNSRAYINLISGSQSLIFKALHTDGSYIDSSSGLYFQSSNSVKMTMTSSGNVGIGTTSPSRKLYVNGQIGLNDDLISENGTNVLRLGYQSYYGSGGFNLTTEGSIPLTFGTSSTERMRITSGGNLLLGQTSDFGYLLQVNGTSYFQGNALFNQAITSGGNYLIANATATKKGYTFNSPNSNWGVQTSGLYFNPIDAINATPTFTVNLWNGTFGTAGYGGFTDVLTINGAGGAAAFSSSVAASQFKTPGFVEPASVKGLFNNTNYSGPGWDNASLVTGNGATGVMMGGDTASYTYGWIQGVQTDNGANKNLILEPLGGNVGIGTTSPSVKLHVIGSSESLRLGTTTSDNYFTFFNSAGTQIGDIGYDGRDTNALSIWNSSNGPVLFGSNGSEKMRITSGGNVGIGTSSPSTNLEVVGTLSSVTPSIRIKQDLGLSSMAMDLVCDLFSNAGIIDVGTSNNTIFRRGSSESMRIANDGYIGINTSAPNTRLHLRETVQAATAMTIQINEDMLSGAGLINFKNNGGSTVGSIYYNGFSTSYNTSSDYRLKENVVKMDGALERLKLLKPVNFNFINRPEITVDGFIAHEVQEVIPEAVVGVKDELDENGKPKYQGIDQSKIVPLLTAALQEAIDKISQLEERIQKLENK